MIDNSNIAIFLEEITAAMREHRAKKHVLRIRLDTRADSRIYHPPPYQILVND